jgi:nucleoside-diphosphate-sugar epimerase
LKVLVTGGSGFIGSHLVGRLLAEGFRVLAPHRDAEVPWRLAEHAADRHLRLFEATDLSELGGLAELIRGEKPDVVVHAAAYGVQQQQFTDPCEAVRSNVLGTTVLAEACGRARTGLVVYLGTALEYQAQPGPITEEVPLRPAGLYGATKAAAWTMADFYARVHGLPLVTLRAFSSFGPRENSTKLIPYLIDCALNDRPLRLQTPEHVRDYVYVADVAEAVAWAVRGRLRAGHVYNVATGRGHTVRETAELVYRLLKVPFPRSTAAATPGRGPDSLVGDPGKLRRLGWEPRYTFEQGLAEAVGWYAENWATVEALS